MAQRPTNETTFEEAAPRGHNDWFILLSVLGMMFFSVAFVYSASANFAAVKTGSPETFFWSQMIRVLAGIGIMLLFARIDYHWLLRWSKPLAVIAVGVLVYVLLEGTRTKGATRWIDFGFISFQPSEFAKFALMMHVGVMLADKRSYIDDFKFAFMPMLAWVLAICGLVALQPNFSTAGVIFILAMALMFIGRVRLTQLFSVAAVCLLGGGLYAVSAPYRMKRIMAYIGLHSGGDSLHTMNHQLHQGLLGFGSGGFVGVGAGQSRQRLGFLPESFGDFIFSIIGEEYGFIGTIVLLAVFGLIVWRGLLVARQAPDDLGRNVAAGVTITLGAYALINACVTTGLLPTTGLPMPFISYGGSSVLFSAAAVGVLLNISQASNVMPREERVSGLGDRGSGEKRRSGRQLRIPGLVKS